MTGQRVRRGRAVWPLWLLGLAGSIPTLLGGLADAGSVTAALAVVSQWLGLVCFGGVGLLLTIRRPGNAIGWVFLVTWTYYGVSQAAVVWAQWAARQSPPAAGADFATWVSNWSFIPLFCLIVLYPVALFPDGRPAGPRWGWLPAAGAIVIALWTAGFALQPSQYANADGSPSAEPNPFAPGWGTPFFDALPYVGAALFTALVLAALTSLAGRFRHGDPVTRQQIKWLLAAGALWLVLLLYPGDHGNGGPIDVLDGVCIAATALAVAVAIMRYHLYDIDRIISRTTSYAIVTSLLLGTYTVVVTLASRVMGQSSTLAVAAATLTAAAAARPLLVRTRRAVDRRFNRSRFDAQRIVDDFGRTLRTEVDDAVVAAELVRVLGLTVQPGVVGLLLIRDQP